MKKKITLFCILLVPIIFGIILYTGENQYLRLPYIGNKEPIEKIVDGKTITDTLYHTVAEYSFINQDGKAFGSKDLKGKVYVADFFFTSCGTICPKMTSSIANLQKKYANDTELVNFISFTVDPEVDNAPTLKAYAKKYNANTSNWNFVTGSKEELYDLAKNSFLLNAVIAADGTGEFIHSERLMLIDPQGHIRGQYDGTDDVDVKRCEDEIKVLEKEVHRNKTERNF